MKRIFVPHKTNTTLMAVTYTKGAIDEEPGKEGVAHLVEHCLMHVVHDKVPGRNIITNAFTNYYTTTYAVETVPKHRKRAELFTQQIMKTEKIPEDVFRKEVTVVKSEIMRLMNSPPRYISRALLPKTAIEGRRALPVQGTLKRIEHITIRDVNQWIEEYAEPMLIEYGERVGSEPTPLEKHRAEYLHRNVSTEIWAKGYYGAIVWTAPLTPELKLLVNYLGNNESHIWNRLREQGLYIPLFGYTAEPLPRVIVYFETGAPLPNEDAIEQVFEIVLEAIDEIRDGNIDKQLLEHAKTLISVKVEHHIPALQRIPQDVSHLMAVGKTYVEFARQSIHTTEDKLMAAAQSLDKPRFVRVSPKNIN